jgi:hypothetical protein
MTTSNTALIDGDIIVYKIAYEKQPLTGEAQEGFSSTGATSSAEAHDERSWESVKESIDSFMQHLRTRTRTTHYAGFLSPKRAEGFRNEFAKTAKYKGNRETRELPYWFQGIKDYLISEYNFQQLTKIEADDAMSIVQTAIAREGGHESIICSIDKDLMQVGGKHFNWQHDTFYQVDHVKGYKMLWKQALTGDSTDNIIGCGERIEKVYGSKAKKAGEKYIARVGVGPKEADKIIEEAGNLAVLPGRVLVEFINRYGLHKGINMYHEAFNLVFMLREWPIWEPPLRGCYPWVAETTEEDEEDTF